jgi:hypothetical protein
MSQVHDVGLANFPCFACRLLFFPEVFEDRIA